MRADHVLSVEQLMRRLIWNKSCKTFVTTPLSQHEFQMIMQSFQSPAISLIIVKYKLTQIDVNVVRLLAYVLRESR